MPNPLTTQIHATCVETAGIGVLLRGPSGSGKSDLALRLIESGARLVADDRTDLTLAEGVLVGSCPQTIAGRLEVRGIGIVALANVARTRVGLAVDLAAAADIDRLPGPHHCTYLGIELPLIAVAPFEASAVAKLRLAAREVALGRLVAA
jgi:serine kinase of HPr protein (carbohydrate metabolism regulator)